MLSVIITVIKRSLFLTLTMAQPVKNYHSIVWKGDCCAHRTLHQQRVCAFSRLAGGARVGQFSYHIPISIPILFDSVINPATEEVICQVVAGGYAADTSY